MMTASELVAKVVARSFNKAVAGAYTVPAWLINGSGV